MVEHNVEYVESQQQVNFINAQIIKAGTQQTLSIVNRVRALCFTVRPGGRKSTRPQVAKRPSMIYKKKDSAGRADGACVWNIAAAIPKSRLAGGFMRLTLHQFGETMMQPSR